jgi:hypothetical protein
LGFGAGAAGVTDQIGAARHILVRVAAWDFNCSKYITKRVAISGCRSDLQSTSARSPIIAETGPE